MKRSFLIPGITGTAVVIMSIFLLTVFPGKAGKLPEGFSTPVIAFEFIKNADEARELFNVPDPAKSRYIIDAMDRGNRLDFIYMVLYSSFLFLFSRKAFKVSRRKLLPAVMILSFIILTGDFLENIQLLAITSKLQNGDFSGEIKLLRIFTWQKWGGLAISCTLLAPYFIKGNLFSKAIAVCGISTGALGLAAFMHRSILNEIFSLFTGITFALITIYCLIYTTAENRRQD
ncbi:MAG TPA: hypothetical protein PK358_02700 [Spirochaetota bacterium]|nr:hypothetical protein [Spirochaetota bacterium]